MKCEFDGCDRTSMARGLCHRHYMRKRRSGKFQKEKPVTDAEYLAERSRLTESGCIEWTQSRREGYGRFGRHGKFWAAHVYSYITHVGPLSEGQQVNHRCHNRACINPQHLYAGTQLENMQDMTSAGRGRYLTGIENGMSKLNPDQVMAIRQSTDSARIEAAKHGVSQSLICAVRQGRVWRAVADVPASAEK